MSHNGSRKIRHQSIIPNALAMAIVMLILLLPVVAPRVFADVLGQEFDKFNRFVQASSTSDSASSRLFLEGRTLIASRKWTEAAKKFEQVIKDYPSSENVDVALYWLGYALAEKKSYQEADRSLERLLREYPNSTWVDDARAKRIELAALLGRSDDMQVEPDSKDEIRVIALQSLFRADATRAIAQSGNILKRGSNASPRLKEAAVELLGHYGGKDATPLLVDMARNEQDQKLRKRAIYALARRSDDSVLSLLKELVTNSSDGEIAKAALWALASNRELGKQSYDFFVQIAKSGKTVELRKQAITGLFRFGGDQVVDELLAIYRANDDIEIKKAVITALGSGSLYYAYIVDSVRGSQSVTYAMPPGADAVLMPSTAPTPRPARGIGSTTIAPSPSPDAVSTVASAPLPDRVSADISAKQERAAAVLVQLYDSERNEDLKAYIISALGNTRQKQATKKLIDIARSESSVKLKKLAIASLSMSKDPEVVTLLEELIK